MPTIATKITDRDARSIAGAAKKRRQTISAFLRTAAVNEASGREAVTFGQRFGHLVGVSTDLPANKSMKEGYAD